VPEIVGDLVEVRLVRRAPCFSRRLNTAPMAARSCSMGASGELRLRFALFFFTTRGAVYTSTSSRSAVGRRSASVAATTAGDWHRTGRALLEEVDL